MYILDIKCAVGDLVSKVSIAVYYMTREPWPTSLTRETSPFKWHFNKTTMLYNKSSGGEDFAQKFWRRRFLNFVDVCLEFCNYFSLEKGVAPSIWTNLNPLQPRMLFANWLILAQWFYRRRFFNLVNVFRYFVIIPPWKRACSVIWLIE